MDDFTDITSYYPSATPTQEAPLPGLGGEGYVPPTPTPEIASPGTTGKPTYTEFPVADNIDDFSWAGGWGPDIAIPTGPRSGITDLIDKYGLRDANTGRVTDLDYLKMGKDKVPASDQVLAQDHMRKLGGSPEATPLWQQEWAWTAWLSMAALFYQVYQDRENRKTQMELYNQQLKIREQERKDEYDQAVSLAKLQSQLAIAGASANKGGAVVRGGFN